MGFFDSVKSVATKAQESLNNAVAAAEAEEEARKQAEQALAANPTCVLLATGTIHEKYEIMDAIFAMDSHQAGFFSGADPGKAFDGLKQKLRMRALMLGANAVIDCQFEYRVALGENVFGSSKQVMELFAYGTAVRRH